jgi:CRP-like cAMP-binding protein
MVTSLVQQKDQIKYLIENHEIDKAVTLLCRLAVTSAQNGQFDHAEAYRDLLYEVDSTALVAIMKINESIEDAKRHAIQPQLKHVWPDFFKQLSSDEVNAFFHALQQARFDDDHTVLKQGNSNDRLYLVDRGVLKVVFKDRGQEVLIHQIGRGNVFGEDTFFSVNVCTTSVITLSTVHLQFLDHHRLKHLEETFPVMGSSLKHICASGKLYDHLRAKKIDRRATQRIHLKSKVAVQLLTAESRHPMQRTLYADLWDVSKSGLCFHLHSKNKEAVRRLIGRSLGVRIKLEVDGQFKAAAVTGVVQGVQNHSEKQYSVHMQLNPPFSDAAMDTIQRIAAPNQ